MQYDTIPSCITLSYLFLSFFEVQCGQACGLWIVIVTVSLYPYVLPTIHLYLAFGLRPPILHLFLCVSLPSNLTSCVLHSTSVRLPTSVYTVSVNRIRAESSRLSQSPPSTSPSQVSVSDQIFLREGLIFSFYYSHLLPSLHQYPYLTCCGLVHSTPRQTYPVKCSRREIR